MGGGLEEAQGNRLAFDGEEQPLDTNLAAAPYNYVPGATGPSVA